MADPIIAFPFMHAELAGPMALPGLAFFDPGLAEAPVAGAYRPDGLPLAPGQAAAEVARLVAFGDGFKDPRGLAAYAASEMTGFAPDSSMAMRKELADRADPGKAAAARQAEERLRAQTLLGLAYRIEAGALELAGIDAKIGSSYAKLQAELGLSLSDDGVDYENCGCGDDDEFDLPGAPSVSESPELPPWRQVLSAMLVFLPPGCALVTADAEIAATWEEFGAKLAEPDEAALAALFPAGGAPAGLTVGRAPGYALVSRTTPDPDRPWLDAPRTVVFLGAKREAP